MRIRFDRSRFLQTAGMAAFLAFCVVPLAHAQSGDTTSRLTRIENEIDTLSRAVFKGETPPAGTMSGGNSGNTDIQNRLSQIEMDLQALTGKVEELGYEVSRMKAHDEQSAVAQPPLSSAYPQTGMNTATSVSPDSSYTYTNNPNPDTPVDNGFSMTDPEAAAPNNAPSAGSLDSLVNTIDQDGNVTPSAVDTPMGDYETAFAKMRNQDYEGAQAGFDAFIKANPESNLVPNAMYWLGETYYVRNQFEEATRVFAEAYQKYPKGPKAPDNLLKLAMALSGQGKTKDACVALMQLKKEYPVGAAPVLTRGDQETARMKCKDVFAQ